MVRLFCVTVYVFNYSADKCLMLYHRKLQKMLPPGGKVDPNEIPDVTAVRECFEETGANVELIGERAPVSGGLMRPYGMQLNTIIPEQREHIDFIYLALANDAEPLLLNEREAENVQWFSVEQILQPDFDTFVSVKTWTEKLSTKAKEILQRYS